jgi:RNA polymerase sigma-70 factor (ECF subfamily)
MSEKYDNTNNALFKELGRGSQKDLKKIYILYFPSLVKYIFRIVLNRESAKEIATEALEILWENRDSVATMEAPLGWLFVCAYRCSLKYLRSKKKRGKVVPLEDDFILPATDRIEMMLEAEELSERIDLAIDQLPAQQRIIIRLKTGYDLSRKEIAERLHLSESTVKNQITSANKRLRTLLGNLFKHYLLMIALWLLMLCR